jgi:hypothetical protein
VGSRERPLRRVAVTAVALLIALGGALGGGARPVLAVVNQASADSNVSAFRPPCVGFVDSHPAQMLSLATAGLRALGYTVSGYSGTAFSHAAVLARTASDVSFYVHSHGDEYWNSAAQRRYNGFREDSGDCNQAVVFSSEIAAARAGRASNLVVISTCHNADPASTLPGAFGIARTKAQNGAAHFYLGYVGIAYDNDEQAFEKVFWSALKTVSVGEAFDLAADQNFSHPLEADWWGTYNWSGFPGAVSGCTRCLVGGEQ